MKNDKKHNRRIRNLILLLALTGLILGISTYAWFIGMQTVRVSGFDVEIASTEDLLLSLNGETWATKVGIDSGNYNKLKGEVAVDIDYVYPGHTNWWTSADGTKGLVPVSSIGEMDDTVSRLMLYEKASLTPSGGGYRIMASRMKNYTFNGGDETGDPLTDTLDSEAVGYVAFDLFIKNISGADYIAELNEDDEEAIYLDVDSSVKVAAAGAPSNGVANTGIENSVRVAFAQIGRVKATETLPAKITAVTCANPDNTDDALATGICREAQIWEPNDTSHVQDAINYYNTSCRTRGTDGTYGTGTCSTVTNGFYKKTYAVAKAIASTNKVDVYDGLDYNGYEDSIDNEYLKEMDYFTDTEKILSGMARPEFMTLAANSITKIRIYIYLEGQDVDNYDWASIGKAITVNFGFTKQRFDVEDFGYEDPVKPTIHLAGDKIMYIPLGSPAYSEPLGTVAVDLKDGDLTGDIVISGDTVDTNVRGTYLVKYTVSDKDTVPNTTTVTRTVIVH